MGTPLKNVKASVEYVSGLLSSLGIGGLSPEVLRQAKFNSTAVAECLLRAIHDLVILQLTQFPSKVAQGKPVSSAIPSAGALKGWNSAASLRLGERRATGSDIDAAACGSRAGRAPPCTDGAERDTEVTAARAVLDELWRTVGNEEPLEDILAFVKFYLALWGFPAHSPVFILSFQSQQSRHLLLALGWLVSHCRALERGFHRRIQPLLAARASAPLPCYPPDVGSTPEATAKGQEAKLRAQQHLDRVLSSVDGITDSCQRAEARAHQALMLYGKVQATFKSIYSLRCCRAKRVHQLNQMQIEAAIEDEDMRPYSQYELHLLQDKEALKLHITALEAEQKLAEEVEAYESHEQLFWEWMESVVHEAQHGQEDAPYHHIIPPPAECNGSGGVCVQGVSAAELQPLIRFLQQELSSGPQQLGPETQGDASPPRNLNIVEGINMLPPDIAQRMREAYQAQDLETEGNGALEEARGLSNAMSLGLGMEPLYVYDHAKGQGCGGGRHAPPRGDAALRTAADRIQGLTDIAVTLARVLAKVRARNRAVIQGILQPLMEDDNYVIVGL